MNLRIETTTVTKHRVTAPGMDLITVIFEDMGPRRGKLTVESYGDAWSYFWGGMGDRSVREFVGGADGHYIAGKLYGGSHTETDFERIERETGIEDASEATLLLHEEELVAVYGEDWPHDLPRKNTSQYEHLLKIVAVVREVASLTSKKEGLPA